MKRIILTIITAMLLGGNLAWADDSEDAVAAYNHKDYATALKIWRQLAAEGNAPAQAYVGVLYAQGQGVPQDYTTARQWYEKAAAQGDAKGQFLLGARYAQGQGVLQDYTKAAQWFEKAAAQGYAAAQFTLGVLYANGNGVPRGSGSRKRLLRAVHPRSTTSRRCMPGERACRRTM
jgi:TPR repeat protein